MTPSSSRRPTSSADSGTPRGAQRRVAGDAHEHEPRDDGLLGLPGSRRPSAAPDRRADPRLPARILRAVRRHDAHPLRHPGAQRVGRLARRRRAVRRASSWRRAGFAGRTSRPPCAASPASSCTPSTTPAPSRSRDRRVLVYGNGISGLEIATDLAPVAEVDSACRTPRYVIRKNVDGVSSDWQWYTELGALQRRELPAAERRPRCCATGRPGGRPPGRLRRPATRPGPLRRRYLALPGLPRPGRGREHRLPTGIAASTAGP